MVPAKGLRATPSSFLQDSDPTRKAMNTQIFNAFLVIVVAAILFMLPLTDAIYDFRTDLREDAFNKTTGVDETTANVTLHKPIYDADTDTIDILSSISTDTPLYSSYDNTTRLLGMTGLADNSTRILTVSYDIDALAASNAINILLDRVPFIWLLSIIAFPMAALFAIFTGRA